MHQIIYCHKQINCKVCLKLVTLSNLNLEESTQAFCIEIVVKYSFSNYVLFFILLTSVIRDSVIFLQWTVFNNFRFSTKTYKT